MRCEHWHSLGAPMNTTLNFSPKANQLNKNQRARPMEEFRHYCAIETEVYPDVRPLDGAQRRHRHEQLAAAGRFQSKAKLYYCFFC
jgi:hypothetical protein